MARQSKTQRRMKPSSAKVTRKQAQQPSRTPRSTKVKRKDATMQVEAKHEDLKSQTTEQHGGKAVSKKQCTLRVYQARDIPRMVDILAGAIPQLPNYAMITPDRDRIKYVLDHNIQNAASFQGWVLCDSNDEVQGGGAGWCVQNLMSKDFVADDVIMWIEPEFRNFFNVYILVNTYLEWAKARGAKLIRASHTGGSFKKGSREQELYDKLLSRLGFKEVGSIYHYSAYGE